jgi:hypothetical protein
VGVSRLKWESSQDNILWIYNYLELLCLKSSFIPYNVSMLPVAFRVSIDTGYSHGTYSSMISAKTNSLCLSVKTVNLSRLLYKLTVSC